MTLSNRLRSFADRLEADITGEPTQVVLVARLPHGEIVAETTERPTRAVELVTEYAQDLVALYRKLQPPPDRPCRRFSR